MRIEDIRDHPGCVDRLGRWAYDSWGRFYPGKSLEETTNGFRASLVGAGLPATVVAVEDGTVIGTASLVTDDDLPGFSHLAPWLASVYVDAPSRSRGVGALLVDSILARARALGHQDIYLWTEDAADYYAKRGWRPLASSVFHGVAVSVLTKHLAPGGEMRVR